MVRLCHLKWQSFNDRGFNCCSIVNSWTDTFVKYGTTGCIKFEIIVYYKFHVVAAICNLFKNKKINVRNSIKDLYSNFFHQWQNIQRFVEWITNVHFKLITYWRFTFQFWYFHHILAISLQIERKKWRRKNGGGSRISIHSWNSLWCVVNCKS